MTLSEPGLGVWQEVIKGVLGSENRSAPLRVGSLKRCCPLKEKKQKQKKTHNKNQKWRVMFHSGNFHRHDSLGHSLSQSSRNCSKELREEPGYLGAFTGERQHTHTQTPSPHHPKKKKKTHSILSYRKRELPIKGRQVRIRQESPLLEGYS